MRSLRHVFVKSIETLPWLLGRLESLGVHPAQGTSDPRRAVLANRLAITYILFSCPYFFLYLWSGMYILAWALLPILLWLGLTFVLNARGWSRMARFNLALCASVSIVGIAITLGRAVGAQALLLVSTLNFLLLFDWRKERPILLAGLVVNSALFLGFQSLSFHAGSLYALDPGMERHIRLAISFTALLGLVAAFLHFQAGHARVERHLIAAREKAQAADRLKSRFIANMSHEIRTPLNVILGLTRLMENPGAEAKRREHLASIQSSAAYLLAILNDVLDLSKIEAGRMRLESVPFRVRELAESVLATFHSQASQKGLQLLLDMEAEESDPLQGDPLRLRQVLNNLLSNSLKFTSRGAVVLRIRREGGDETRPMLRFEVSDTGAGIPEAAQRRLFRPFQQADDSINRSFGGTGLGLAICKRLVELMGGTIALRSRPGAGTMVSFSVAFDLDDRAGTHADETADAAGLAPAEGAVGSPGGPRILIVEDHPLNRMVLEGMLEAHGFKADEAHDGKQALDAWAAGPYDLILMDCHMPVMDGLECTRRLRAMEGPRPVIIGVTADAMAETRNSCLRAGMDQVILKPLNEKELRSILAPWIAARGRKIPEERRDANPDWVDAPRLGRLIQQTRLRDPEYRKRAFAQFQADAESLRAALREAGRSGRPGNLKDPAHGLKGLCLTMGLDRLAEACKRLEAASLAAEPQDWSPVLAELEAAFDPSLADLRRILEA
jgi:signal transduction histidine kinase/CheY-like chemotaxis protein